MAERRMMSKKIIHSDAFLDLPSTTQNLYFHLLLEADDEGFVNNPKRIQRTIGASDGDAQILVDKKFIILFDSGIIVIKHWRIHNYIQNDRFKATTYVEERAKLSIENNGGYKMYPNCTPSIVEISIEDNSLEKIKQGATAPKQQKNFIPPTIEDIDIYVQENSLNVDTKKFFKYYTSSEWKDNKGKKVKNWKLKLITWDTSKDNKPKQQDISTMPLEQIKDLDERMAEAERRRQANIEKWEAENGIF